MRCLTRKNHIKLYQKGLCTVRLMYLALYRAIGNFYSIKMQSHSAENVLGAIKLWILEEIRNAMQVKFPKNITGFEMATPIDISCCFMIGCWAEKLMHTSEKPTTHHNKTIFLGVTAHIG